MKLFLASSADKTIHLLKDLVPKLGNKVLFITNAADPYEGTDTFWVTWDREKFKALGYELNEIDLRNLSKEDFINALNDSDILHICGGSVFYIVSLIRERGFEELILDAIKEESIIYTGTSAGSIIVSKNIKSFSYHEDAKECLQKVSGNNGLGLIDFVIVPHANSKDLESVASRKKMIEEMQNDPTALFFLQDNQALWVENDNLKFLEVN